MSTQTPTRRTVLVTAAATASLPLVAHAYPPRVPINPLHLKFDVPPRPEPAEDDTPTAGD